MTPKEHLILISVLSQKLYRKLYSTLFYSVTYCHYVCFQGSSQCNQWDNRDPMEEQQEETVTAGATEGLSGGLVPWSTLGQREGPQCYLWNACRGTLFSSLILIIRIDERNRNLVCLYWYKHPLIDTCLQSNATQYSDSTANYFYERVIFWPLRLCKWGHVSAIYNTICFVPFICK